MTRRLARGFTLIELMTVVAIAAILAMVAVPSFTKLIASQRMKTAASNLQITLLSARAEAIKRNGNVCVSTSTSSCTGSGAWNAGWYVIDTTTSTVTVINTYPAYPNLTFTPGSSNGVTYQSSGRISTTSNSSFTVSSSAISDVRCVSIGVTGVPTVTTSGC